MAKQDRLYGDRTWEEILYGTISRIKNLSASKGEEYKAVDSSDQLANFRAAARDVGVPMEVVWRIYAGKHWGSINTYVRDLIAGTPREYSEPMEGRVDDLIVYLILFKLMLAERGTGE